MSFTLSLIKPVEFETTKLDPFGFDEYAERLGGDFLPFATVARKPAYYFFIAYANWLQEQRLIDVKATEFRLRIEKLLVRSWIYGKDRDELRSKGIIGVSTRRINPFKGNDGNWVVKTCFDLYGKSVKQIMPHMPNFMLQKQERELAVLRDFFAIEGPLNDRNQQKLEGLLKRLIASKSRFFRSGGELTAADKRLFLHALKKSIREKNTSHDLGKIFWSTLRLFLDRGTNLNREKLAMAILDNRNLPFFWANRFMAAFIKAVESDLTGKSSRTLWETVSNHRNDLKLRFPTEERKLCAKITHPSCWVVYEAASGQYCKGDDFDENKWDGYMINATKKSGHYHSFRTGTLANLIIETGR